MCTVCECVCESVCASHIFVRVVIVVCACTYFVCVRLLWRSLCKLVNYLMIAFLNDIHIYIVVVYQ